MPKNSKTIIGPINGLEIGAPGSLIDTRQTPRCKNVEINRSLIRKRSGGGALGLSLGERIHGFGNFTEDAVNYLIRVGATKVEALNGSTWNSIAHAALTADDTATIDFAYPLLAGKKIAVYTNLKDNIRKYTGSGNDADLGGLPPKCKFMLNYSGYLLLLNVDDGSPSKFRSRVQWCDTGDIESWDDSIIGSNAGVADLLEDDIDITGGAYFGAYAAIHKETSIYLGYLTGTDQVFRFDRKETAAGAVAHKSIVNLPTGQQAFLSKQGLRLFNGITAPLIQSNINLEIAEGLNPTTAYRSWGIIVNEINEVWFGMPIGSDTDPTTVYKYNYLTGQIYKDEFLSCAAVALFQKTSDDTWDSDPAPWDSDTTNWDSITSLALNDRVIRGNVDGTSIERTSSPDDNGVAVSAEWESKDFTAADFELDDPEGIFMEWQGLEVIASGNGVTVSYSTDEGVTWTAIKTFTLTSAMPTDDNPLMGYFIKVSTKCRFKFENNTVGGNFNLKQFRPLAIPREVRGQ